MFRAKKRISPFASYSVRVNTNVPDEEEESEVAEINADYDEDVAVKPKKVKHRLPGIRLLRELEKQRLKELEKLPIAKIINEEKSQPDLEKEQGHKNNIEHNDLENETLKRLRNMQKRISVAMKQ